MQTGDTQLGKPAVLYKNTKANIEALAGIAQGAIAYATDTDELGTYDGVSAWTWSAGGGGGGTWGSITGTLSSQTDLQSALDGKQAVDGDLTAIAALTPANDDVLQRKAGAWTNRTIAQLITDLGLGTFAFISSLAHSSLSGIGTNTHSQIDTHIAASNPHSGSQPLDSDLTDIAALTPSNDDVLQRKAGAWTNRTIAQLLTDLGLAALYAPIAKGVTNGDSHDHNGGDGAAITDANLSTSDITTNDASTTKHGFLKKLSNVASEFISGTGVWTRLLSARQLLFTHGKNTGIAASTTNYLNLASRDLGFGASIDNISISDACTIDSLYVTTNSTQPASGSLVITVTKNGADTALTITIAAGTAANTFSDTTHSVTVAAGDSLSLKFVNNATATSALLTRISSRLLF